jgi:hypothetical protein
VLVVRALENQGQWTSGRIQIRPLYEAPAGGALLVTALIRQPNPAQPLGYWPALWMLGPGQGPENGEIDILEDVNGLSAAVPYAALRRLSGRAVQRARRHWQRPPSVPRAQTQFPRYTVLIDRAPGHESIHWYVHNQAVFTVTASQEPASVRSQAVDHGFSIIFDLAMDGRYPDGVSGLATPTPITSWGGLLEVRDLSVFVPDPGPGAAWPPALISRGAAHGF